MNPSNGTGDNFNVPQTGGVPVPAAVPGQGLPQPQLANTTPLPAGQPATHTANDEALLEQAIAHAENIINQTRFDPQQQSMALERLKVDYVQRKFGRSIKVVDN